jgi:BirA family biotin operon repressor/biotin-[acetyl-CoA-carboxylase] ligase
MLSFVKNNDSLSATITNNPIGQPFIELPEVDSTNNYAMAMVQKADAQHGLTVFTHLQTAGKGQRGKTWTSNAGENVMMSVVLNTSSLQVSQQFQLTMAIALAATDVFEIFALSDTYVKWPNDIYWRDRKAGGILIENIIKGQEWQWAVVGIGININQTTFSSMQKMPVSLKQITGKTYDTINIAKQLCNKIEERFEMLIDGKNDELLLLYNERLFMRNQQVRLKKEQVVFTCSIKEVTLFGELIVSDAMKDSFSFGEVEWIL